MKSFKSNDKKKQWTHRNVAKLHATHVQAGDVRTSKCDVIRVRQCVTRSGWTVLGGCRGQYHSEHLTIFISERSSGVTDKANREVIRGRDECTDNRLKRVPRT